MLLANLLTELVTDGFDKIIFSIIFKKYIKYFFCFGQIAGVIFGFGKGSHMVSDSPCHRKKGFFGDFMFLLALQKIYKCIFTGFVEVRKFFCLLQRLVIFTGFPVRETYIIKRCTTDFGIFSIAKDLLLNGDGFS